MVKQLIINADDYAMSAGVSRGILHAHRRGLVTSTSCLVNTPSAPQALAAAKAETPALGLGLHINLSFGRPVLAATAVASLVNGDGSFCSGKHLLDAMRDFRADHVRREVQAQFTRFVQLAGRPPDHLDSHQHIACLQADVFTAMLELAETAHIPIRDPGDFLDECRLKRLLAHMRRENGEAVPSFEAFQTVPRTLRDLCRELPRYRSSDALRYEFYGSEARPQMLLDILDSLPEGATELMCHPGYAEALDDSYTQPRERELAILTDPALRDALRARGIELVSFAVLGQS